MVIMGTIETALTLDHGQSGARMAHMLAHTSDVGAQNLQLSLPFSENINGF